MRSAAIAALVCLAALSPAALVPEAARAKALSIDEFQEIDQRLQNIGWRLARANAEFCAGAVPSVGLTLQDAASYPDPDGARRALGLTGSFAVQTAADGSPAALSGAFPRYREVAGIGAVDPNLWDAKGKKDWTRLSRVYDRIEQELTAKARVTIRFADGTTQELEPVRVCPTRFETFAYKNTALADGSRVVIGAKFPGFKWPEDSVFAGVVAHELGHNLLGHTKWLDRNKRSFRHTRQTEREADRLMPWLMANAGYDPEDAVRFMKRWGKKHDYGLLRSRKYEGWDERAEHIAAEVPIVRDLMKRTGKADWSVYFRREIDPDLGLAKASGQTASGKSRPTPD